MARKTSAPKRKAAKPRPRTAKPRAAKPGGPPAPIPGAYVHVELYSDVPDATKKFYSDVFGWKFEERSFGEGMLYRAYRTPGQLHGGLLGREGGPFQPPAVLAYIAVDSVTKAEQRIAKAGGKVLMPKYEIPNVGWMAVFEAPGGVVQAVWENNPAFMRQA